MIDPIWKTRCPDVPESGLRHGIDAAYQYREIVCSLRAYCPHLNANGIASDLIAANHVEASEAVA